MMSAPRPQRIVGPDQMARLSSWNARKPVIAIMGEFSAGKSTLLNMLIGRSILPTQVTATKLPPVWLRHGSDAPYRVDKSNNRHLIDLNNLAAVPVKDTRYIRIFCEAEVLESCDLLDTPGISDPNIPMNWWIKTLGYANAVLWCSHAGQAWRESERSAWESLPERLRRHSLLLVTRSDKITSDIDRMKIDTRLRRETENLFGGRLFISLTNALRALEGDGDADLWSSSGAETFVDMLAGSIAAQNDDRSVAIRRYRVDPSSLPRVTPRRVRPGTPEDAGTDEPRTTGGAEVVTLRPMRVVATNDSPVEAAVTARPTLHEVMAPDQREGLLILDDALMTEARDTVVDPAPYTPDPAEIAALADDLSDDAAFVRETMSLSQYDDAVSEPDMTEAPVEDADKAFETGPAIAMTASTDAAHQSDDQADALTMDGETLEIIDLAGTAAPKLETPEEPGESSAQTAATDQSDQSPDSASAEASETDFDMIAGLSFEEVSHDELLGDDTDADSLTILAKLSHPDTAAPNPFDQRPAFSAEETISSVMATLGDLGEDDLEDDSLDQADDDADDLDGAANGTASHLWHSVLSQHDVRSVDDMMQAMTAFVAALDAAGFQLKPGADAPTAAERELAAIQHRRRMRAARRRQG